MHFLSAEPAVNLLPRLKSPHTGYFTVGLLLIVSALFAGSARAEEALKIGVGTRFAAAPLHVAASRGYFDREGITVSVVELPDNDLLDALADDDIDLATQSADFLLQDDATSLSLRGAYILAQSSSADALLARSSVQDTRRLRGRRIALTPGTPGELLLRDALQQKGRRLKDVTTVRLDQAAAGAALLAGDVDAAVLHGPALAALERTAINTESNDASLHILVDASRRGLITDLLVGREDVLAREKTPLQGVIRALDRAIRWMRRNPDETVTLLAPLYQAEPGDVSRTMDGTEFLDITANMALVRGDFQKAFSRMSEVLDTGGDGRAREVPSANRFLALSALRQVAARR